MKHLLLLGGGHAHVQVLKSLAQEPLQGVRVTLVSPFVRQIYSGMVPGFVAGHYGLDDCAISLAALAERARAEFIESSATRLDAATRSVTLADHRELRYDVVSIDTGGAIDRDAIPGAREFGLFVRPIEQFTRLWGDVLSLAEQRDLSVSVIGAGAAGVELALAMQYRLGQHARLSLVTGGLPPLAAYPLPVQLRARKALRRFGITVLEDSCARITATHVQLGQGTQLQCDAPVVALGVGPAPWLAGSGLALDASGFVATGPTLQSTSHPEAFAAGDVATNIAAPRPKSGVFAVRAGPALALNLRRYLGGAKPAAHRSAAKSLNLLSCGSRHAIASWGAWSSEGRWVWHWKDRIDRRFIAAYR